MQPFEGGIRNPDSQTAVEMAYTIAVFMRRVMGRSLAKGPSWSDIRRELARATLAYLTMPDPG